MSAALVAAHRDAAVAARMLRNVDKVGAWSAGRLCLHFEVGGVIEPGLWPVKVDTAWQAVRFVGSSCVSLDAQRRLVLQRRSGHFPCEVCCVELCAGAVGVRVCDSSQAKQVLST